MNKYIQAFIDSFYGTLDWTWNSIVFEVPWYTNYFWGLIVISFVVWLLEIAFPWRKNQAIFRKDFWLDAFYMFFNFFIFAIVINGFYSVIQLFFNDLGVSISYLTIIDISVWPMWLQLLVFFIVLDFVQWITHVLLHRFEVLWRFHQVHHLDEFLDSTDRDFGFFRQEVKNRHITWLEALFINYFPRVLPLRSQKSQ